MLFSIFNIRTITPPYSCNIAKDVVLAAINHYHHIVSDNFMCFDQATIIA